MSSILVVDHDPSAVSVTSELLRTLGHRVYEATPTDHCLTLVERHHPDLILLGIRPGDVAGSAFIRGLREKPELSGTFIVGISSSRAETQIPPDQPHYVDGFITRPVSDPEFVSRVQGFLQLKQAQDALRRSESRFRRVIERNADGIVIVSRDGRVRMCNQASLRLFRLDQDALMGRDLGFPLTAGECTEVEVPHGDGDYTIMEMRVVDIEWEDDLAWLASLRDVTERYDAQQELQASNRALRLISACNETVLHASDEQELLEQICRTAVTIGEYDLAWVGLAETTPGNPLRPVHWAGEGAGFIGAAELSWDAGVRTGLAPAGEAIRRATPMVYADASEMPHLSAEVEPAIQQGYGRLLYLPLCNEQGAFGVLGLYGWESQRITDEELALLQRLSRNLAFGIEHVRTESEKQRVQETVLKVASGVSASVGTEFFEQLAVNMNQALGSVITMVARVSMGEDPTAETLSVMVHDEARENFEFRLAETPCLEAFDRGSVMLRELDGSEFPWHNVEWPEVNAGVIWRLDNSAGQPIGFVITLFAWPLEEESFVYNTIQIFASRAAAEIERRNTDVRIRDQASLLDKAQDAIIVLGMDQRVLFWNQSAERLYGWGAEEAFGQPLESLVADSRDQFSKTFVRVLQEGEWKGEIAQRHRDGHSLIVEGRWTMVRDDDDRPQSMLVINTDITQRKEQEREIEKLAFFDPLTRLPNRRLLVDRLQQALVASGRNGQVGALLFLDLDNFKILNDTLGHDLGDELLRQVAVRLRHAVRQSDTVARLGGDEFVVMLPEMDPVSSNAAEQAALVGDKILKVFSAAFELSGQEFFVTTSIGIALFGDRATSVDQLLKRADLAMYQAKEGGRNSMRFFDDHMESEVADRAAREKELRRAINDNEFVLFYQPQIDFEQGVTGCEALARWQHPERGIIGPAEFIPLAEETGLIVDLGRAVISAACEQLVMWSRSAETAGLTLAVNVSARQFRHPEFVTDIRRVLDDTGANPNRLKLEVTESLLLDDIEQVVEKMASLRELGVTFSLDDFGTGYSSLFYLKTLPLDQLKIDQSFVRDILEDANDAVIARTVIRLGQSMGLSVIAEGVETREHLDFLRDNSCLAYQGFYFSKPIPASELADYLREGNYELT
ncbi:MAG: EAL domain-containing protein [Pseudomonadota bacterium]